MEIYNLFLLICWVQFFTAYANEDLSNMTDSSSSDTTTLRKQIPKSNIVTIDLRQCFCSSKNSCDLTIIKSSLMEESCNAEEELCCPMVKSQTSQSDENDDEVESSGQKTLPNNNVRIYSIFPTRANSTAEEQFAPTKPKSKRSCSCKPRGSCPHKYIDYGFGFHCSYSTVHCCIPEDDPNPIVVDNIQIITSESGQNDKLNLEESYVSQSLEPEGAEGDEVAQNAAESVEEEIVEESNNDDNSDISVELNESILESEPEIESEIDSNAQAEQSQGELLITEVTNWSDEQFECLCLPMEECMAITKYDVNSIERRRDMLCDEDSIQCCGREVNEEITKKSDDAEPEVIPEFPPYQQPIQLPGAVTVTDPAKDTVTEQEQGTNFSPETEEYLQPPNLPTQYHSYERDPISYQGYTPSTYPAQLSGPVPYQKGTYYTDTTGQNIRPWIHLSSPTSYSRYNPANVQHQYQYNQGYPRSPYPYDSSNKYRKPGGLLDTLSQMLG